MPLGWGYVQLAYNGGFSPDFFRILIWKNQG